MGGAGEGAGSNTELRWRRSFKIFSVSCRQSEMALAKGVSLCWPRQGQGEGPRRVIKSRNASHNRTQ